MEDHEQKLTWKVPETSSLPQLERKKLRVKRNQKQAEFNHTLKKRTSVKHRARNSNLGLRL